MKKFLPLLILFSAILLSGCQKKSNDSKSLEDQQAAGTRLVINQLDQNRRPFTVLSQHSSGKLLAFYLENTSNIKGATVDLEYLSGDLLKGVKSTLESPIKDPYAQSFLLGSCSAGGKCSFDRDLISGSLKLKLKIDGESDIHVLKGDYSFVNGETTTTDGRVTYSPQGNSTGQILMNTLGLPKKLESKLELYPIAITTINNQPIKGELTIKKKGIKKVLLYNGSEFKEIKADIGNDQLLINLNHSPRQESVTITRDDLKGTSQNHTFYILGPIILLTQ